MMKILVIAISLCLLPTAMLAQEAAPRAPASSLTRAKGPPLPVDARGFIHRWLVLEPVPVPGRLTESAVQDALKLAALSGAREPRTDGALTTIQGTQLAWHALDTTHYNVNLYHFAYALSKPTSNVLFWVETEVDAPREMAGVRLAIGSNAASRWWLNDEPVIALNDDRQAVIDDGVSKRVTLRQGRNVIRAAIINGGGATDFCARFLDANDQPVTDLRASVASPAAGSVK
jgi:hypothetical protein